MPYKNPEDKAAQMREYRKRQKIGIERRRKQLEEAINFVKTIGRKPPQSFQSAKRIYESNWDLAIITQEFEGSEARLKALKQQIDDLYEKKTKLYIETGEHAPDLDIPFECACAQRSIEFAIRHFLEIILIKRTEEEQKKYVERKVRI